MRNSQSHSSIIFDEIVNQRSNAFRLTRHLLCITTLLLISLNQYNFLISDYSVSEMRKLIGQNYYTFNIFQYSNLRIILLSFTILINILCLFGVCLFFTWPIKVYLNFCLFQIVTIVEGGDQISYLLSIFYLIYLILIFILKKNKRQELFTIWKDLSNDEINSMNNFTFKILINLLLLQCTVIYLDSFIEKMAVREWVSSVAIFYFNNDPVFGSSGIINFISNKLFQYPLVLFLCTYFVLFVEFLLAISIFLNNKQKNTIFYLGIFLHFLFAVFFGLFQFSVTMIIVVTLLTSNIQFTSIYENKRF